MLFCLENLTRKASVYPLRGDQNNLLVYFRSSVTATPPLGELLSFKSSLNSVSCVGDMTVPASFARLSRIWRGVSVDVGIS